MLLPPINSVYAYSQFNTAASNYRQQNTPVINTEPSNPFAIEDVVDLSPQAQLLLSKTQKNTGQTL